MRVAVDWRSTSKDNYKDFCKKYPDDKISFKEWKALIYAYNRAFVKYLLETGEKGRLPSGLGEFAVNKRKRKKLKEHDGKTFVNLPVDWKKTKEKGKMIYIMNYHTEGYSFRWNWFPESARFKYSDLFFFKPSRETSRLLNHYLKSDEKYQHIYATWKM